MVIFENKTFLNLHLKFCKKSTYMCSSVEFNVFIKEEVKNSLYTIYKETIQILNIFHLSKTKKKTNSPNFEVYLLHISQKNGSKICNSFYCWESISWFTLKKQTIIMKHRQKRHIAEISEICKFYICFY